MELKGNLNGYSATDKTPELHRANERLQKSIEELEMEIESLDVRLDSIMTPVGTKALDAEQEKSPIINSKLVASLKASISRIDNLVARIKHLKERLEI